MAQITSDVKALGKAVAVVSVIGKIDKMVATLGRNERRLGPGQPEGSAREVRQDARQEEYAEGYRLRPRGCDRQNHRIIARLTE